jgi:hypothetical protein
MIGLQGRMKGVLASTLRTLWMELSGRGPYNDEALLFKQQAVCSCRFRRSPALDPVQGPRLRMRCGRCANASPSPQIRCNCASADHQHLYRITASSNLEHIENINSFAETTEPSARSRCLVASTTGSPSFLSGLIRSLVPPVRRAPS